MALITWTNSQDRQQIPAGNFTFTLPNGFEPGTGQMQLDGRRLSALSDRGEVEIAVIFEGDLPPTFITIKDLYVQSYTRKTDSKGNSIYTVHLKDRRFLWQKFGEITLFANFLRPDGTYEKSSLNSTRPFTWKEVVLLCLAALGEEQNLLSADALPENPYPLANIDWQSKNPAQALSEILAPANYTLALHYDGKISIIPRNEDSPQTIPAGYGPAKESGELFAYAPESILILGAPIINQVSVELEPCAVDTDGKIKALDEVSYLRAKDIPLELATNFASLAKEPFAHALARATVGLLWRIPNTGLFSDDRAGTNRSLLPILSETCESSAGEFLTPKLCGAYFEKGDKCGYENFGGEGEKRVPFPKGWAIIDRKRGLVKTQKVSGTLTETDIDALPQKKDGKSTKVTLVPLLLTFATYAREPNGSTRHFRVQEPESSTVQELKVQVIRRPDMRVRLIEGKPLEPLYSQTVGRARALAHAILSQPDEASVEFGTYAGMQPLRPSGTITSITWTADSRSGYTHFTYDGAGNSKAALFTGAVESTTPINGAALETSQAQIAPTDEELRIINANKHGPVVIKRSQKLKERLKEAGRRDDTESNLFAELEDFDEEHQEPQLSHIAPAEELNWNYREHIGEVNPEPDSQDAVWALQLASDDKYAIESALNRSTEVVRVCDENKGDLDDIWRVRAIPGGEDVAADLPQRDSMTRVQIISEEELYRVMWLINTLIGGEGGWITDVPPEGVSLYARSDEKIVAPPRRIGQIGNIVILTDDDEICITKDGDTFTYANIRHDAHFHKAPELDGRIYFVADVPPEDLPEYVPVAKVWVKGDMRCDPALKNIDTELGKESGEWRPCVPIPIYVIKVPSGTVLDPADYPVGTLRIDSDEPFKTYHASDTSVPADDVADEWQEICQKQSGIPQGGVIIAQDGVDLSGHGYYPKGSKVRTYERLHEPCDAERLWRPARGQIIFQTDSESFVVGTGAYSENWWSDLLSALWRYDIAGGSWEYWGEFPVATNNSVAVTVVNGDTYDTFAGAGCTDENIWNAQMWRWDSEEEDWEEAGTVDYGFNSGIACTVWRKVAGEWVKTALVGLGDVGPNPAGRCYYYDNGYWVYVGSPFPGESPARTGAVAFTIDSTHETYIGLGTDGVTDYRDLWVLSWKDGVGFVWSQSPLVMPDIGRCDAVSYVTEDERAYIGMGRNMKSGVLDTWWSYDHSSGEWQRENSFDGEARHDCAGIYAAGESFVIGGYNISACAFYGDVWMSHRLWLWVKSV